MRYEMILRRLRFEDEQFGVGYPLMFEHDIYRVTWFGLRRVLLRKGIMSYQLAMEEMREDFISRSGVKFDVTPVEDKMIPLPKYFSEIQNATEN